MPYFKYRAKISADEIIEEKIEAQNRDEAIEKISAMGYFPVHVEEDSTKEKYAPPRVSSGKIKSSEVTIFTRQLATLIRSGIPILNALNIISEQFSNPAFKVLINRVHDEIKNGSNLSNVLTEYPRLFSPIYIALVHAGETTGNLPTVLSKITDYRRKQEELLSRVRAALAYPIFMAVVGIATVVFMLTFVMPKLMGIFVSMGQSLPLPTQILIAISLGIRKYWFPFLLAITLLYFLLRQHTKTKIGKITLSMFKLKFPVLGALILKTEIARFCGTLELLIKTGIPILQAIEVSVPILGNEIVKQQLLLSRKELEQGGSFGKSLKNSKLFPVFVSNLIIVGEESGKLDDALSEVAGAYEADIDESIKVMTSLLEPAMILVMGLIVGFIVISMLLPLFQINISMH
jgi:type II secretory pathway component PulF